MAQKQKKQSRVVHCHRARYDVYIGSPSIFENPWKAGRDGNHTEVAKKHREWLNGKKIPHAEISQKRLAEWRKKVLREIPKLHGKILSCWCKPKPCHGDYLLELANT